MDFEQAKKYFSEYLKQYNSKDEKIRLKIVHTYGVVSAAKWLAQRMGLSLLDTQLALHIALLHDIGRFEQLKIYHSFDDTIVPHAQLSLDILFHKGLISSFIPERDYDQIIYDAIKNHGLFRMEDTLTDSSLLHAKLIRDADKLDNFRVKFEDSMTAMVDVTEEQLGKEPISDSIYQCFLESRPILNSDRITHMDMWVSYLGYIFDLNFPESRQYVLENDYINRLIDRIPYSNPKTQKKMERIRSHALDYLM